MCSWRCPRFKWSPSLGLLLEGNLCESHWTTGDSGWTRNEPLRLKGCLVPKPVFFLEGFKTQKLTHKIFWWSYAIWVFILLFSSFPYFPLALLQCISTMTTTTNNNNIATTTTTINNNIVKDGDGRKGRKYWEAPPASFALPFELQSPSGFLLTHPTTCNSCL